jgi:(1->4)-alpha-D-glucan 1-alpha-D-glucosylmutase
LLHRLLVGNDAASLRAELFAFVEEIAPAGAINGLAQTLLRLTMPGVPDLYQGAELWDLSLVDPDNRRPVDFALRHTLLGTKSPTTWRDGALKQALIVRALGLRAALPQLFARGSYEPVSVEGRLADHVVAFLRRHDSDAMLVVVPRLTAALSTVPAQLAFEPRELADTRLVLPAGLRLVSALDDSGDLVAGPDAALQQIWHRQPVALLSTPRP